MVFCDLLPSESLTSRANQGARHKDTLKLNEFLTWQAPGNYLVNTWIAKTLQKLNEFLELVSKN